HARAFIPSERHACTPFLSVFCLMTDCSLGCFLVERLGAMTLQRPANVAFYARDRLINRSMKKRILSFREHTGEVAENDFDSAGLIDAALRSVDLFNADADAFDRLDKFAKLCAEFPPDISSLILP